MDRHLDDNRKLWNAWTKLHSTTVSACYDLPAFRAGSSSLKHIEIEELGDVTGKTLLHLQCHFGVDTLSWARRGARVTGLDLSDEAIALARKLAAEQGLAAEFVCGDVLDLAAVLGDRRFEIIFSSYGVLAWLSDLDRWARNIASHLASGGVFYLVEFHPLLTMFDDDGVHLTYPYFGTGKPERYEGEGSYAAHEEGARHVAYEWSHGVGDVVTALVSAGLSLEYLHEFPYSTHNAWPFLDEQGPERFTVRGLTQSIPHLFSIRAHRVAEIS